MKEGALLQLRLSPEAECTPSVSEGAASASNPSLGPADPFLERLQALERKLDRLAGVCACACLCVFLCIFVWEDECDRCGRGCA